MSYEPSNTMCGRLTAQANVAHRYLVGSNKSIWIIDDKVMITA